MTIVLALLSLLMGVVLGTLGGGGSILTVPILAYVAGVAAGEAVAASLVVVAATSFVGAIMHARNGAVEWKTGLLFGLVAMFGAYGGGRLAIFFPGWMLLALFAALMVITSVAMLRKSRKAKPERLSEDRISDEERKPASLSLIAAEGLAVGAVTGLVGAGGGFLVVPALTLLGGLSMRKAIGTSLMVIALKSMAGVAGHLSHVQLDWSLVALVTGFAILGSLFGTGLSKKLPADTLRVAFAWFVLAMGTLILSKEIIGSF